MLLSFYQLPYQDLACEQALQLGESREVMREQQAKRDTSAWGFAARSPILSRFASLAIKWRTCSQAAQSETYKDL